MEGTTIIKVRLSGIRPLMFDRYPGDNQTSLPTAEKLYLDGQQQLIMPAINVLSLLAADSTRSVTHMFFGKQHKTVALGIRSYCNIVPFEIPIEDDAGQIVWKGWNGQISRHFAVARIKKAGQEIPNPKERPLLALPWYLSFSIEYQENKFCTLENLRQAVTMGGILGLGTFRPYFGRYELKTFDF